MYQYIRALCLSRSIGSQWEEVDLQDILLYDIFNHYTHVYLELSNIFFPDNVYVDLEPLRSEFSSYQDTLNAWLLSLGNRALPTVTSLPNTQVKYAKYSDAVQAGYKIGVTKIGVNVPSNYPPLELVDLELRRPRYVTDMTLIHRRCMVSVNGYYHQTDTDGTVAYVYQGGTTMRKTKDSHLGILSFLDIGDVHKLPITLGQISPMSTGTPLRERVHVKLNFDLTNKSVFLVLGGYLVFPKENVLWQTGDDIFALNFAAIPMLERYFESKNTLDLSSLGLMHNTQNLEMVNVDDFYSDLVLQRYLLLSQSFFVVVDTPNLFTNKLPIKHCNMPGVFTAYQDPTYPLIVNYGKVADYWKVREGNRWAVTVTDSYMRNFVLSTKPTAQLINVTDQLLPSKPFYFSQGHLLEIGSYPT